MDLGGKDTRALERSWEPLHVGQLVRSSVTELDSLPASFTRFSDLTSDPPLVIGLGFRVLEDGLEVDGDLSRFFMGLGATLPSTGNLEQPIEAAVQDFVRMVADDYRHGELFRRNPTVAHQLYGTIISSIAKPPTKRNDSEYPDHLTHLDFVPPEVPCWGHFAWDSQGTAFQDADFYYEDVLEPNYRNRKNLDFWRFEGGGGRGIIGTPDGLGSWRTTDARTLLHHSSIRYNAPRVFARCFTGPIPDATWSNRSPILRFS